MISIRIDWVRRLFVIVGADGEAACGFKHYKQARQFLRELQA